jgi:hypothetical protein
MIASLKSERLKTPNEGSKPEFHLRWIRELVPINACVDQTDQLLPGWSVIRKLARYVSQNSQGQLDFRKSDRLIACLCVRLAAAVASAAGRVAGNTCA